MWENADCTVNCFELCPMSNESGFVGVCENAPSFSGMSVKYWKRVYEFPVWSKWILSLVWLFKWDRSFSPGSCCLINDYLKISSTGAVWAKLKQTTTTKTPTLCKNKYSYSMEKSLIWRRLTLCSSNLSCYLNKD